MRIMKFVTSKVEIESAKELSDYRKAMVRPYITYSILGFYGICTLILGGVVLKTNTNLDSGLLTIYTGLSTLTASIVSFWFGGRGASKTPTNPEGESNQVKTGGSGSTKDSSPQVPTSDKIETKMGSVISENEEDQTGQESSKTITS